MYKVLISLIAAALFGAAVFAQDGTSPYQLGAGDEIRVTVFGEIELSGEYEIDGTGRISLPLIGSVVVGGQVISAAEARIVAKLADGYLVTPRVNIEVMNYRPFYIIGEVKSPGSYPYVSGMTVLNAVALGSGFTYRANKKKIEITRRLDGKEVKMIVASTAVVRPGDIIRISERFF